MFVGRKKEKKRIEESIIKKSTGAFVLYGRECMGKTKLALETAKPYPYVYYYVKECSLYAQLQCLSSEFSVELQGTDEIQMMRNVFEQVIQKQNSKGHLLFILDEFQTMADREGCFFEMLEELGKKYGVLFLLISSSVSWVENDMIRCLGKSSAVITQIMKLDELDFADAYDFFPQYSTSQMISVYSILGGVPGLLKLWDPSKSVRQNVIDRILSPDGVLHNFTNRLLKRELRELSSYHTILMSLARNTEVAKLNDLYEQTKYSRAKISVYLKNLIEMDLVEKVFSYGEYGKDNTVKGLYRIKDAYLRFYYTFVFPNLTLLECEGAEAVYDKRIGKEIESYYAGGFRRVCTEYLRFMNELKRLPMTIEKSGVWYGKDGTIDLIADNSHAEQLVALCKWENEAYSEEDFEDTLSLMLRAGIDPDYYYIFSKSGFLSSVETKTKAMDNFNLISLEQL